MKFVAFNTFGVLIDSLHIADVQFDTDFRPWLIQILTASDENVLRQISDYLKEKLNLKFHFNLNFFFGNFYSKNHNLAFIYVYNLKKIWNKFQNIMYLIFVGICSIFTGNYEF